MYHVSPHLKYVASLPWKMLEIHCYAVLEIIIIIIIIIIHE